jgi:protease-4
MGADEVLADAGTITGSIGVFGVLPTFEKTLDKVGVGVGGASTSWLAAASSPLTPMDKRLAEMVQLSVGQIYQQFITLAAQARGSTPEKINEVAQGRVWTGQQALERGLVDRTGSLREAVRQAAALAKLDEQAPLRWIEREPGRLQQLASLLEARVVQAFGPAFGAGLGPLGGDPSRALAAAGAVSPQFASDLGWLMEAVQQGGPRAAFAHCLCRIEP